MTICYIDTAPGVLIRVTPYGGVVVPEGEDCNITAERAKDWPAYIPEDGEELVQIAEARQRRRLPELIVDPRTIPPDALARLTECDHDVDVVAIERRYNDDWDTVEPRLMIEADDWSLERLLRRYTGSAADGHQMRIVDYGIDGAPQRVIYDEWGVQARKHHDAVRGARSEITAAQRALRTLAGQQTKHAGLEPAEVLARIEADTGAQLCEEDRAEVLAGARSPRRRRPWKGTVELVDRRALSEVDAVLRGDGPRFEITAGARRETWDGDDPAEADAVLAGLGGTLTGPWEQRHEEPGVWTAPATLHPES